ncbi:MAG: hypothetical protein IKA44_03780, partial [Clostridia bacterium]|nr:hypothetical protein [Clostridia bacterium]
IKKGVLADYGAGATLENVHLWATVDFTGATGAVRLGGFFGTVGDGDLTLKNCSVNGSMTHNPDTALAQEHTVGCFIGCVPAAVILCNVSFNDCENNMSITDNNGATVGGVAGYVGSVAASGITVTVKDSLNTGDMNVTMNDADSNIGSFGGFVGSYTSVNSNLTMTNCVNKGDIKGLAGYFGGLAGSIGAGENYVGVVEITNCVNYGEADGPRAGGIIGRATPNPYDETSYCNITNCVNYGTIRGVTRAGGIGVSGNSHVNVTYCVNAGEVLNQASKASQVDAIWNTSQYVVLRNNVTLTWAKYDKANKVDTSHDTGEALLSQTNEGAGVRIVLDGKGTGLRFKFTMDEATVNALKLLNAKAGAIFLPTELLEAGKDLTAENYANALVMEGNASEIKDGYYYASLVNLFENHYETEYSCQSFWRYQNADGEWVTVYANNTQSRTIKDVATEALAAIENGQDTNHYTEEQITLLNQYAAGNPTVEATN